MLTKKPVSNTGMCMGKIADPRPIAWVSIGRSKPMAINNPDNIISLIDVFFIFSSFPLYVTIATVIENAKNRNKKD